MSLLRASTSFSRVALLALRTSAGLATLSCAAIALLTVPPAPVHAQTQAVDVVGGLASQTGGPNTLGWSFNLDTTIKVTQLGLFDLNNDGFANNHQVGLWDSAQTPRTSTTLGPGLVGTPVLSSGGRGSFRYVDVPNVILTPGTYYLGADYTRFEADQFLAEVRAAMFAPGITFNSAQISLGNGFAFPSQPAPDNGTSFFGPNFRFTAAPAVAAVPEPSEYAVAGMFGATLLFGMVKARRRKATASASNAEQLAA